MTNNIENQVAVVTGAGGNLGLEIVKQLLAKGFSVAATDISAAALTPLNTQDINTEKLKHFVLNVADKESVNKAAEKIEQSFAAPITVLVNNAGIFRASAIFEQESNSVAEDVLQVNLLGMFYCTSAFAKPMVKNKYGRIINIASIAGIFGAGGASAYAASKAGLIGATKSWARDFSGSGVVVNAIAPGFCKTQMVKNEVGDMEKIEQLLLPYVPVGRFGLPSDIAEVTCFLATVQTNYINGEIIAVDGGIYTGSLKLP